MITLNSEIGFESKTEIVTSLDALRRQFVASVWMFFEERDAVALHTTISAANEIGNKACIKQGLPSPRDELLNIISNEHRERVGKALNSARNTFKHLAGGGCLFNEESNVYLI